MAQTETGRTPVGTGSVRENSTQDDPRAVKLMSTAGTADPRVPTRNTNPMDPQIPNTPKHPDTPTDAAYPMSAAIARSQPTTFFPVPLGPLPLGTLGDPNLPVLTQSPDHDGDAYDPRETVEPPSFGPRESVYPSNIHDGLFSAQTNVAGNLDVTPWPNNPRPVETGGYLPQTDNSPNPLQPVRAQVELT